MTDTTIVDCLGKPCPVPVIELAKAVASVPVDGRVVVISDDPASKVDIPVWCRMKAHELVDVTQDDDGWRFQVRRTS